MSKYQKTALIGGKWAKASELKPGMKAKIMSETTPAAFRPFTDSERAPKTQEVCDVQVLGNPEALNVGLNRATSNGVVGAFGEDSRSWMYHLLTVETEKVKVAGKSVFALYLVPDGYEKVDDENGYTVIVKQGANESSVPEGDGFDVPF